MKSQAIFLSPVGCNQGKQGGTHEKTRVRGRGGDGLMDSTTLTALVSLVGTLAGTFGGILVSNRLTTYRIEQLEKKVAQHNSLIERTYKLEGEMQEVQHDIRDLKKL